MKLTFFLYLLKNVVIALKHLYGILLNTKETPTKTGFTENSINIYVINKVY